MRQPRLLRLRQANKTCKSLSHSRYVGLLLKLCSQHIKHHLVAPIPKLIRSKDWPGLLAYADSLSSLKHDDATSHFVANQFAALIRKYPWDPSEVQTDPEGTARSTWKASEHRCKRVNQRFRLWTTFRSPHEELLSRVRGFIRYAIGDEPDLQRVYEACDFTAGASLGVHGNATNLGRKLSVANWTVTPSAFIHFFNALASNLPLLGLLAESKVYPGGAEVTCWDPQEIWGNYGRRVDWVTHNKIGFVPKTARTLRSIAVEPIGNGFLQKGTDIYLRRKLKDIGLDLSDQSRNRFFAKFGSEDWLQPNGFCTIDLSSASDSIATEVCRSVLPAAWFDFLNQIRSKEYVLDDSTYRYEKFCSMGNGFCFPLETLLFSAIVAAAGGGIPRRDFVVYGDDIIVRKTHFDAVIAALKLFGFKPNTKKTFSTGPFRESCGADWYAGEDVRPYTLDERLDSVQAIYKFLNLSRRNSRTSEFFQGVYPDVLGWLPVEFHFWRPFGPPDGGIDVSGLEHLVSPLVTLDRKFSVHRWYEVSTVPLQDPRMPSERVRILCHLRGDNILFLRRRTKSRLVRKHGG